MGPATKLELAQIIIYKVFLLPLPLKVTVGHRDAPAYSFGLRHSEFITPVLDMVV